MFAVGDHFVAADVVQSKRAYALDLHIMFPGIARCACLVSVMLAAHPLPDPIVAPLHVIHVAIFGRAHLLLASQRPFTAMSSLLFMLSDQSLLLTLPLVPTTVVARLFIPEAKVVLSGLPVEFLMAVPVFR